MKKPALKAQKIATLPGIEKDLSRLPREHRLKVWMSEHGIGLIDLCGILGSKDGPCHKSYPGKVLISCVDRLPDHHRAALTAFGIPDDLLPPRIELKTVGRPSAPKRPNPLAL